jgi:hypothetical protein
MKQIIHVDHDKVAVHVARSNHDPLYNPECPIEGIAHIYDYTKFETIFDDLDSFLEAQGRKWLVVLY